MMLGDASEDTFERGRTKILADVGNSMVKLAVLSGVRQGMPCLKDRYNLNSHDFDCEGFDISRSSSVVSNVLYIRPR